jgi:ubiquinone/menaquinone biosynthesis C-methylase UbiE
MGFYSNVILPRFMDRSMASPELAPHRQAILAEVEGEILEIGFGSGVNLSYYPHHVEKITTIDANPGMNALALRRIATSGMNVENRVLNGETLPFPDNRFDYVVSTYTLCSIAQVDQALGEIYRVLKPGGKFVFAEHGLSDKPGAQLIQQGFTPISRLLADNCHANRNIQKLVEAHFDYIAIDRAAHSKMPQFGHIFYRGTAVKAASPHFCRLHTKW